MQPNRSSSTPDAGGSMATAATVAGDAHALEASSRTKAAAAAAAGGAAAVAAGDAAIAEEPNT